MSGKDRLSLPLRMFAVNFCRGSESRHNGAFELLENPFFYAGIVVGLNEGLHPRGIEIFLVHNDVADVGAVGTFNQESVAAGLSPATAA